MHGARNLQCVRYNAHIIFFDVIILIIVINKNNKAPKYENLSEILLLPVLYFKIF
jgi:hypothetical protein